MGAPASPSVRAPEPKSSPSIPSILCLNCSSGTLIFIKFLARALGKYPHSVATEKSIFMPSRRMMAWKESSTRIPGCNHKYLFQTFIIHLNPISGQTKCAISSALNGHMCPLEVMQEKPQGLWRKWGQGTTQKLYQCHKN